LGLRVPEDLSVIGFDDIEVARHVGLTTVRQPLEESGALAAEMLLGSLSGDGAAASTTYLDLSLTVRSTTSQPSS
ncbi:MAG TPA: substrate-binding domain-containing protein, partial [Miltoncostaeales bacterium]|nr:substrate-binding domain-containing protein [Miltoncostaeales bacterium]